MKIIETDRLLICQVSTEDAPFILELFNDSSFLEFMDNKGVDTIEKAEQYILNKPLKQYAKWGFGMFITRLKESSIPIGICGLMKRDHIVGADIGFALLSRYCGKGYAKESASALISHGKSDFGLKQIVALTDPRNIKSIRVLERIGLKFEKAINDPDDGTEEHLYS